MRVGIQFNAEYTYEEDVSFSPHIFRLFPRPTHALKLQRAEFETNPGANVHYRHDIFDNPVVSCFYPEPGHNLFCGLQLEVDLQPFNPFEFLLAPHAADFVFIYTPEEAHVLAPYLQAQYYPMRLPFWSVPATPQPTVNVLVGLNEALHREIRYTRRETGPAQTPSETLAAGEGSCRDYMVLLAETLRGIGLAARLASGYLCEFGAGEKYAEGSLHAWVEVYLPGAGWIGMDPTNGMLCNENHICAAVGLTIDDVAATEGDYFHDKSVVSQMTSTVTLRKLGP